MDSQEQSLVDRIKQAQNVLVTVSVNPSVDQLAAAIGLTVALNKLEKHGTAVFSGDVPSTLEFLKPEETLEKNTDSLRDFIIALDKSKADKLRYKVEDQVVRIFITPYKTSLSEKDLDFSQGDFNVDVVVALGVAQQQDIDVAISAHGRILHDATVTSVSTVEGNNLGTINWVDTSASSLSEMMLSLIDGLGKDLLDNQIATALLTGIVASTDRFRNEKTSPKAMSASAELMGAGANQQLIATELESPPPPPPPAPEPPVEQPQELHEGDEPAEPPHTEPGELDIIHDDDLTDKPQEGQDADAPASDGNNNEPEPEKEPDQPQIHVDDDGTLRPADELLLPPLPAAPDNFSPQISEVHGVDSNGNVGEQGSPEVRHERMTEPPTLVGADMTANSSPDEEMEPSTEELSLPPMPPPINAPLLKHNEAMLPATNATPMSSIVESPFMPQAPFKPAPQDWRPPEQPEPAPSEPPQVAPMPPMPQPFVPEPLDPVPAPFTSPPAAPFSLAPVPPPMPPTPAPMPEPVQPPAPVPAPMPVPSPMLPPASLLPPPDPNAPLVPLPPPPPFDPTLAPPPPPPMPPTPAVPGVSPDETLTQIEASVHSSHLQDAAVPADGGVADARSAVEAALSSAASPSPAVPPITALNAQPLGPELHPLAPPMPPMPTPVNAGFSEPTPGNTPADETLDMPLPSNPFGPGQQTAPPLPLAAPPSAFPGLPPAGAQGDGQIPPPPVPPPMLPPLQ